MPALALTILVSVIVLPPLFSINAYKSRVASAVSASLGRPVHLSAVELRLLPRPGFVITDLTVQEDPAFGAEPVLHANEVKAAIRLFSLWRGHLEISRISVDEASLNLVRTVDGRWNMDSLFRTAAQAHPNETGAGKHAFPYLEATNSRVNIKKGIEKLPYSLLNADLSFWEENPGDWRVRLKGQPARTDVSLELGDTGIVQLAASMQRAPELRLMPIHVEMEWRQAQLGQLSRLLVGSDPGWRGDLTAEMKLDGTAESAQVTTRLRASGVHRAEFAPAEPLDFDANCALVYRHSARAIENLACNSPLGNGRLLLAGNLPSNGQPKLSVQLDKIPAQAILDALRTVRHEVGAGLEASGTLSGRLDYDAAQPIPPAVAVPPSRPLRRHAKAATTAATPLPSPLTGSITIDSLRLSGGSLSQPIVIQKASLQPAASDDGKSEVLAGSSTIPAGAPTPMSVSVRLTQSGYQVLVKGAATPGRLRQIAQAAGLKEAGALDAIAGDPVTLDLSIAGPWLPAPEILLAASAGVSAVPMAGASAVPAQFVPDRLNGTVTLHNANWKSEAMSTAIELPQAVLRLNGGTRTWDPVAFTYGPLKGTGRVVIPVCDAEQECPPTASLEFTTLDAADLQTALLGSEKKASLLSDVFARFTSSGNHKWPEFKGTLKAESFILGPVTLGNASVDLKVGPDQAELTNLNAELLGGQVHLTGAIDNGDKPAYTLEGEAEGIEPVELCRLLELKCSGRPLDASGKIQLAGLTDSELGSSAKGNLHFDWAKGAVTGRLAEEGDPIPATLSHFEHWQGDARIENNTLTLGDNSVKTSGHSSEIKATVKFGLPPEVTFGSAKTPTPSK